MIVIVFGLEAVLYQSVFTTYVRISMESRSWGYRVLGVLVLVSYTTLVRFQHKHLLTHHLAVEVIGWPKK
jgi:hypothetical protein